MSAAPGHVYVVNYSDGVFKVGRTSNPGRRMQELSGLGRKRGAVVLNTWVRETPEAVYEESVLRFCGRIYAERAWGAEHFRGDFREVIHQALHRIRLERRTRNLKCAHAERSAS